MRYIYLCLLLVLLSLPSQAGPFSHMRDSQVQSQVMEKLQETLSLSDEQKKQLEPIVEQATTDFKALRSLQGADKKARATTLIQKTLGQVRPILNEVQRRQITDFLDLLKHSFSD